MRKQTHIGFVTLAVAALGLTSLGFTAAQEAAGSNQTQHLQIATGTNQTVPASTGRVAPSGQSAQRQLGPGDGTGNGSPGRLGAGSNTARAASPGPANDKAARNAVRKASRQAATTGTACSGINGQSGTRGSKTRARDLSGAGGGACTGTGQGPRPRAGGSGGGGRP
jgi:hypothetical protein